RFFYYALNGTFDEDGLVGKRFDLQGWRNGLLDLRQQRLDPVNDVERRGIAIFLDGQESRALAVYADDVGLRGEAITHPSNIPNVSRCAADCLNRDAVKLLDGLRSRIGDVDVVFLGTDLGCARRQNQILGADRSDNVESGKTLGLQRCSVQVDLHLALLAAIWIWHGSSLNGDQSRADKIEAIVVQLLFRDTFAGKA